MNIGSGNRARDTLVGDERSHHCDIPAPLVEKWPEILTDSYEIGHSSSDYWDSSTFYWTLKKNVNLIDYPRRGLCRANINKVWNKYSKWTCITVKIPTGGRQTSWLFFCVAENLNSWPPRSTPASGQLNGTWTLDLGALTNHSAMLPNSRARHQEKMNRYLGDKNLKRIVTYCD